MDNSPPLLERKGHERQRVKQMSLATDINNAVHICHSASSSAGWWKERWPSENDLIVPTKLCLIHSEISEAMEADRRNAMDEKLPTRKGIEVELADAVIRIFDLAGYLKLDLGGAVVEKMAFNAKRDDHKVENRAKKGGKKY